MGQRKNLLKRKLQLCIMHPSFHSPYFLPSALYLGNLTCISCINRISTPSASGWVQPKVSSQDVRQKRKREVRIVILSPFCLVAMHWPTPPDSSLFCSTQPNTVLSSSYFLLVPVTAPYFIPSCLWMVRIKLKVDSISHIVCYKQSILKISAPWVVPYISH